MFKEVFLNCALKKKIMLIAAILQLPNTSHTSCNSFYKRTKISSLEIIIFELKNDGIKWSRIYFEIDRAPSELLLPSAKISAQNGRIGLAA